MNGKALMLIRTAIVLMSLGVVATLGTPAQAGPRTRSAHAPRTATFVTTTIKVTTFNSSFHLSAKTAPRGVVIFEVTNKAGYGHDFSINGQTTKVLKTGHYVYKDTVDHHVQWGDIGGFTIT